MKYKPFLKAIIDINTNNESSSPGVYFYAKDKTPGTTDISGILETVKNKTSAALKPTPVKTQNEIINSNDPLDIDIDIDDPLDFDIDINVDNQLAPPNKHKSEPKPYIKKLKLLNIADDDILDSFRTILEDRSIMNTESLIDTIASSLKAIKLLDIRIEKAIHFNKPYSVMENIPRTIDKAVKKIINTDNAYEKHLLTDAFISEVKVLLFLKHYNTSKSIDLNHDKFGNELQPGMTVFGIIQEALGIDQRQIKNTDFNNHTSINRYTTKNHETIVNEYIDDLTERLIFYLKAMPDNVSSIDKKNKRVTTKQQLLDHVMNIVINKLPDTKNILQNIYSKISETDPNIRTYKALEHKNIKKYKNNYELTRDLIHLKGLVFSTFKDNIHSIDIPYQFLSLCENKDVLISLADDAKNKDLLLKIANTKDKKAQEKIAQKEYLTKKITKVLIETSHPTVLNILYKSIKPELIKEFDNDFIKLLSNKDNINIIRGKLNMEHLDDEAILLFEKLYGIAANPLIKHTTLDFIYQLNHEYLSENLAKNSNISPLTAKKLYKINTQTIHDNLALNPCITYEFDSQLFKNLALDTPFKTTKHLMARKQEMPIDIANKMLDDNKDDNIMWIIHSSRFTDKNSVIKYITNNLDIVRTVFANGSLTFLRLALVSIMKFPKGATKKTKNDLIKKEMKEIVAQAEALMKDDSLIVAKTMLTNTQALQALNTATGDKRSKLYNMLNNNLTLEHDDLDEMCQILKESNYNDYVLQRLPLRHIVKYGSEKQKFDLIMSGKCPYSLILDIIKQNSLNLNSAIADITDNKKILDILAQNKDLTIRTQILQKRVWLNKSWPALITGRYDCNILEYENMFNRKTKQLIKRIAFYNSIQFPDINSLAILIASDADTPMELLEELKKHDNDMVATFAGSEINARYTSLQKPDNNQLSGDDKKYLKHMFSDEEIKKIGQPQTPDENIRFKPIKENEIFLKLVPPRYDTFYTNSTIEDKLISNDDLTNEEKLKISTSNNKEYLIELSEKVTKDDNPIILKNIITSNYNSARLVLLKNPNLDEHTYSLIVSIVNWPELLKSALKLDHVNDQIKNLAKLKLREIGANNRATKREEIDNYDF